MDRCQATDESVIEQARRGPVVARHASAVDSNLVHHRARRGAKTRGLLAPEGEFLELPELDLDRLQARLAGSRVRPVPRPSSRSTSRPPARTCPSCHQKRTLLTAMHVEDVCCQLSVVSLWDRIAKPVLTQGSKPSPVLAHGELVPPSAAQKDTQNRAAGLPLAGDGWWWDAVE